VITQITYIAVGGALGALGRYGVQLVFLGVFGRGYPVGTISVNVIGSFLMGLGLVWLSQKTSFSPELKQGLLIGVLGSFTTFSAFSADAISLFQEGAHAYALVYILLSVGLCIIACWGGILIGGLLTQ
tara:strand:- start:2 stop:385 length:384 start_codon:yes stop_codon:yes gene_type:complete